jgi:hypothetical protein
MTETILDVIDDTYLTSVNPNNNYATANFWYVRSTTQYTILLYDLSGIPTTDVITSAVLSGYFYNQGGTGDTDIDVYRLKQSWVSNQVTFNNRYTGTAWQTAGALGADDYDSSSLGQATCVGTSYGWIYWSLSTMVINKMVDGTYSNYGFILRGSADKYAYFRSLDYGSNFAKLTINHQAADTSIYVPRIIVF